MGNFNSFSIDRFAGLNKSKDKLSILPFQLSKNENYLYMETGGLYERGGGAQLTTNPNAGSVASDPVFSLANYISPDDSNFLVTNQDTTVYYYNSGWQDLSMTLTADKKIRWEPAGFQASRALYGANANESIIKVTGNTPVGSLVANSPTDATMLRLHKNRLFAINGADTLYFTEALAFDTWNTSVNTIDIAPGIDGNLKSIEIWGDALFIFKEFGVYVLPNANDPVPKLNWQILRANASTGTKAPDSVKRSRVGIIYLSSDNFIRVLSPNVSFSSGEYSLGGSESPIISADIQDDLTNLMDVDKASNAMAKIHDDLYVITMQSVENSGTYNDLSYLADLTKFNKYPNTVQPQPYWGQATGFDYDYFAQQTSAGITKLYGAKGLTGAVQETMNPNISNDNGAAIISHAILAWMPVGGEQVYKHFNQMYFFGDTESWNIDLIINAYRLGDTLPGEGEGSLLTYTTGVSNGAVVGTAPVGSAVIGNIGQSSSRYYIGIRGHYFSIEMGNSNPNEFTRINKIILYFRKIRQS